LVCVEKNTTLELNIGSGAACSGAMWSSVDGAVGAAEGRRSTQRKESVTTPVYRPKVCVGAIYVGVSGASLGLV